MLDSEVLTRAMEEGHVSTETNYPKLVTSSTSPTLVATPPGYLLHHLYLQTLSVATLLRQPPFYLKTSTFPLNLSLPMLRL